MNTPQFAWRADATACAGAALFDEGLRRHMLQVYNTQPPAEPSPAEAALQPAGPASGCRGIVAGSRGRHVAEWTRRTERDLRHLPAEKTFLAIHHTPREEVLLALTVHLGFCLIGVLLAGWTSCPKEAR
jgi:hypothetical protein